MNPTTCLQLISAALCLWMAWTLLTNPKPPKKP
jgi:threonine/homoserine/homoserine lactone efflux protein